MLAIDPNALTIRNMTDSAENVAIEVSRVSIPTGSLQEAPFVELRLTHTQEGQPPKVVLRRLVLSK